MKLDLSAAWSQTTAYLSANRGLLLAIAGIFFLLPQVAMALFMTPPQPEPGQSPQQMMDVMGDFYKSALPLFIASTIASMIGTLAMLAIMLDPARPTVGEAIKSGFAGTIPYFLSQLLYALGFGLIAGIPIGLAGAIGSPVLMGLLIVAAAVIGIYLSVKFSMVPALIADRRLRNPIELLKASWALTKGNSFNIFLFFLMIIIVFGVMLVIASLIFGLIFTLVTGPELGAKLSGVATSVLMAGLSMVMCGMVAAIYRQLAGATPAAVIEQTFD